MPDAAATIGIGPDELSEFAGFALEAGPLTAGAARVHAELFRSRPLRGDLHAVWVRQNVSVSTWRRCMRMLVEAVPERSERRGLRRWADAIERGHRRRGHDVYEAARLTAQWMVQAAAACRGVRSVYTWSE